MKLQANLSNGIAAAVNLSPAGQSFAGDYRLRLDMWLNANGPFPAGGIGSTQFVTAGIGVSGKSVEWASAPGSEDYWFAVDSHGGLPDASSLGDFDVFMGSLPETGASGIFWAGSNPTARDNDNPYYAADFPGGQKPPLLQQILYPKQTGALSAGTVGFVWCDLIISRQGSTVEWSLNGLKIATLPNVSLAGSNIFVGYWSPFAASPDNPALNFGLIDNLRVEQPIMGPAVLVQPQSQAVNQGASATFSIVATGTPAPAYQWRFNGTNLAGATSSSYTLTKVQSINVGAYSVVLTNIAGSVTSLPALLTLNAPPSIMTQPQSQYVNEGDTVTFNVMAGGAAPLSYQWTFNPQNSAARVNFPWSSHSGITLTNVQLENAGIYSVVVSNVAGIAVSSNATLRVNLRPVANASATQPLKISSNGTNAMVVLDGSRSYDLDGDALQYLWLRAASATPLATGVVAPVVLPVGTNLIELMVSDMLASSTNFITVTVLTTSQAVQGLMAMARGSSLAHPQPLLAILASALDSIHRGNVKAATNQLQAFEHMVAAQVAPRDAALARQFLEAAQSAIAALNVSASKLLAHSPRLDPPGRLSFAGAPRQIYIIEASTNLLDWERIGAATGDDNGAFEFEDKSSPNYPSRFYRIVPLGD